MFPAWVCLATLAAACLAARPGLGFSAAGRLQLALEHAVEDVGVPGAVAVVKAPGGDRWTGVAGVSLITAQEPPGPTSRTDFYHPPTMVSRGRPMSPDLLFHVGSLKKTMVAVLVLQLVREGALSLEETVSTRLPGLLPQGDRLTLRRLLNHTSGLRDYVDHPDFYPDLMRNPRKVWAPEELIFYARKTGPLFEPGAGWHYANTNYVLLGLMVEKATGQDLDELLEARIVQPLGLGNTYFPKGPAAGKRLCRGYRNTIKDTGRWVDYTEYVDPSWLGAAGAMVSNAEDLLLWLEVLLEGRLLAEEQKDMMFAWTPAAKADEYYGLGVWNRGGAVGHDGDWVFGHQACAYRYEGYDFVVLANGTPVRLDLMDGASEIFHQLAAILFDSR
ncbi:MAG: serine hydrolase domain-containing protein [Thermodesulfobacteriota bacterium]